MSEPTQWHDLLGRVATGCHVSDIPSHSQLLDHRGNPLPYKKNPVGFDLSLRDSGGS
jgi:hypothetical protein